MGAEAAQVAPKASIIDQESSSSSSSNSSNSINNSNNSNNSNNNSNNNNNSSNSSSTNAAQINSSDTSAMMDDAQPDFRRQCVEATNRVLITHQKISIAGE